MKVAFFSNSYLPYLSGVTISVDTLAQQLRALGHRVYIFAPRYPGYRDQEPDVIRLPSCPTPYPKFRAALPFLGKVPEVDIIHSHDPFGIGRLAKGLAGKRKIPFIYTFHTLFTRYTHHVPLLPQALTKFILTRHLKKYCAGSQCILVPSKMVKRSLRVWGIKERLEIEPTGLNFKDIAVNRDIRQELKIPAAAKLLLYVGRISQEKNIRFLIEAFRRIPDAYLVLVGGGPQLDELRKVQLPRMIVVGEQPATEVFNYYTAADLFVFSSFTETQGLVLVEAKSQGLPIVALFAGGLCEVVRSGIDGYLTSRTPEAFVEKVQRLLHDQPLREKMSLAARQDALTRFSANHIAKQVENIYNSLMKY